MRTNLRIDETVDERLDPEKSLFAGLQLLIAYHANIAGYYRKQRVAPDPVFLWELTVLSYNTSPYPFKPALNRVVTDGLPLEKARLADIIDSKDGKPSALESAVGRKKFNNEASEYLNGVRMMLPKNDPRRGGR